MPVSGRAHQLSPQKTETIIPLVICWTDPPGFSNPLSYFSVILIGENGCNLPNNFTDA